MPEQGEQHKLTTTSINPFEEAKPHISEYTAQEIATLSSRLEKQLGPEYISSRPGAGGGKVHYLSADKCINLANEVFGFNGWSSGIQNVQVDFVEESQSTGKVSLGLSVIVRVTLRDGTFHEDIGYGHIENCKGKAAAFEKAKKEGTTDGLKRALRNFGNLLGNCVYDKDYVAKVTKLKIAPIKWDPENLHRHPDFAPVKKESAAQADHPQTKSEWPAEPEDTKAFTGAAEDEFGSDDFDDADFSVQGDPDGVNLEPTIALGLEHLPNPRATRAMDYDNIQKLKPPILRNNSAVPDQAPGPQTPVSGRASSVPSTTNTEYLSKAPNQVNKPQHMLAPPLKASTLASAEQLPSTRLQQNLHLADNVTSNETSSLESSNAPENDSLPIGFFTARAAESLQQGHGLPLKAPAFNPHLDSPSIRKTAGIDRSKSKPVGRDSVTAPPALPRMSFVNPQTDKTRKIGMPASPLLNRGYYKPPQFKRSAEERSVFGDVTNNVGDNKRQRVGSDAQDINHNQGMLNV